VGENKMEEVEIRKRITFFFLELMPCFQRYTSMDKC